MKKYTEGPWEYTEKDYDTDLGLISGFGSVQQEPSDGLGLTICQMCDFAADELLANAHLIAAAPELLEALEEMLEATALVYHGSRLEDAEKKTRLAISKAKGES
jgi:hypothetical protein